MSATDLIALIVRWSYVLVAAVTLWDFLRHRDRSRLDIALMFASLAAGILGGEIQRALGVQSRWLTSLAGMAILAQPYLLLRLVGHFRPLARRVRWLALAGMLISWVLVIAFPSPMPTAPTLAVILYFAGVEAYATLAFVRGSLGTGGVLRRRMRFAAAGSGWLAATLLLAGISTAFPAARTVIAPLSQLCTLLSALSYFVGFSPPSALRKAWQLAELYNFLRAAAGQPPAERVRGTLDYLCPAATRAVDSLGSAVFLWDTATRQFILRASDHPALSAKTPFAADGPLERAWRDRRALKVAPPSEAGPEMARLALGLGAGSLDLLPLASLERTWGVLVSFRLRPSLFPGDDLAVLQLFAEQTAEALETGELFNRQQDLVERLEVANKELEAFSYSVSHDLRSPIRAVTGFSQLIAEDEASVLSGPAQHWLQRVQSNAVRMGRLVDDLLSFSRFGRQSLTLKRVDPTVLMRQVWDDLRAEHEGREVQLELADLPACLADAALLRQVLANLLSNALKFTRQQPLAKITVGCQRQDPDLTYFIQDNGVGFDMAYAGKLFGVFQRLHNVEDFEGTGIGLAIVQRIIERHGGHVTAESNLGQGATFYFTLKGALTDA